MSQQMQAGRRRSIRGADAAQTASAHHLVYAELVQAVHHSPSQRRQPRPAKLVGRQDDTLNTRLVRKE